MYNAVIMTSSLLWWVLKTGYFKIAAATFIDQFYWNFAELYNVHNAFDFKSWI